MYNKSPAKPKVNFLDEHVDNIITENAILRSKLQSKVEALTIMSKQLDKCVIERDHYKLLTEQFRLRHPLIHKSVIDPATFFSGSDSMNNLSGAQLLATTREQNKLLTIEVHSLCHKLLIYIITILALLQVESLKHKLEEAEEDIKALRKQTSSPQKLQDKAFGLNTISALNFEREELVQQLEMSNKKIEQTQADLKSMLDEKEDLINERDAYKCKLHRLNHQLMIALSRNKSNCLDRSQSGLLLDIDALVMENRYLQERLTQAQAEKDLATHALTKYKSILEAKQQKGLLKLGTNNTNTVVTHKQVKQLLECGTTQELPVTAATITDLRALSFGLLDALNDKSLALSHQKKANKILATRISDLEKRLESGSDAKEGVAVFPSKILLESYSSSEVDRFKFEQTFDDVTADDMKEDFKNDFEIQNVQKDIESKEDILNKIENAYLKEQDDNSLTPELQQLVQEALDNLYLEEK
ncbi:coiled-coil domain-containing protein 149-B isoform X1 [Arctopsyche grandis]|uniref:coiled-coil domain-containing protein 149-B isoform X1 n=1 Tax=Arctopsyche grandis TaxID=121162 RepID=UPI00406D7575